MGFLDPNSKDDDGGGALSGAAAGLHLDLDLKRCPACRREVSPWQDRCPDCDEVAVAANAVPASTDGLPDLSHLDEPADADTAGADAAEGDDEA